MHTMHTRTTAQPNSSTYAERISNRTAFGSDAHIPLSSWSAINRTIGSTASISATCPRSARFRPSR